MALPFYMLLHTRIGQSKAVVHEIQKIEGVKVVHSVMGNYDVILYAEGKDVEDVRRIRDAVYKIDAITLSETLVHA
jgi:DNA-binding Lrp family transcriptional regulator